MKAPRAAAFTLLLLAVACTEESSPALIADCSPYRCRPADETSFSFVTLRRPWGPEADAATWRFLVDERVCTLSPAVPAPAPNGGAAAVTISCALRDQPDDGHVPLFVNAATVRGGLGRLFRVETMARATSHVRIERDGVLVDEFDHVPVFTQASDCDGYRFDFGGERVLPSPL
jgi:hypothetical protein